MPQRTVKLFSLNGHADGLPLDYGHFFRWLTSLPGESTRVEVFDDLVFVLEGVDWFGDVLVLHFLSGDPAEEPLLYNEVTGRVDRRSGGAQAWPARQTRVTVDPESRLAAIEARRNGVNARNLERYLERLARMRGYESRLSISLGSIQSESFEKELDEFVRVRQASIVVSRPNFDWDDVEDQMTQLADISNGSRAEAEITAARNQSLDPDRGILAIIRQHARQALTSVVRATVRGEKAGEVGETTLSTDKHQVRRRINAPASEGESGLVSAIVETSLSMIADHAKSRPKADA